MIVLLIFTSFVVKVLTGINLLGRYNILLSIVIIIVNTAIGCVMVYPRTSFTS